MDKQGEPLKIGESEIMSAAGGEEEVLEFDDDKGQTEIENEEEFTKLDLMGHAREVKQKSKDVEVDKDFEDLDFSDMQLPDDIVKGLTLCRYDKPTPIQLRAIPLGNLNYGSLLTFFLMGLYNYWNNFIFRFTFASKKWNR
jgi:hypothetical protein